MFVTLPHDRWCGLVLWYLWYFLIILNLGEGYYVFIIGHDNKHFTHHLSWKLAHVYFLLMMKIVNAKMNKKNKLCSFNVAVVTESTFGF